MWVCFLGFFWGLRGRGGGDCCFLWAFCNFLLWLGWVFFGGLAFFLGFWGDFVFNITKLTVKLP